MSTRHAMSWGWVNFLGLNGCRCAGSARQAASKATRSTRHGDLLVFTSHYTNEDRRVCGGFLQSIPIPFYVIPKDLQARSPTLKLYAMLAILSTEFFGFIQIED